MKEVIAAMLLSTTLGRALADLFARNAANGATLQTKAPGRRRALPNSYVEPYGCLYQRSVQARMNLTRYA